MQEDTMPFNNVEEKGRPVAVKDEGVTLVGSVGSFDFVGAGVTVSVLGSDVTVDIPGGGGSGANIKTDPVTGTQAGSNVELDLSTLTTPYVEVINVFRNGQALEDGQDYSQAGDIITVTDADQDEAFLVTYTY